jgi:hypothetical protein
MNITGDENKSSSSSIRYRNVLQSDILKARNRVENLGLRRQYLIAKASERGELKMRWSILKVV